MIEFSEKLLSHCCFDRVFFTSTGAEANEGAIKLARKYGQLKKNHAIEIITTWNSFHGRTLAALSVPTAQRSLLWIDGAEHLDPESARALEELVRDATGTASVLLLTAAAYPRREEIDETINTCAQFVAETKPVETESVVGKGDGS